MPKYEIDKYQGIFKSRVTEARYFESIKEEIIPEIKKSIFIGLGIYWLYSILDFILPSAEKPYLLLLLKIIPTISSLLLINLLKRIKNYNLFYLFILFNLFIFVGEAFFFFQTGYADPAEMALTQLIFIMGVTLLIPNSFAYSMAISIVSSVVFFYVDIARDPLIYSNIFIIGFAFATYNIFFSQFARKTQIVRRLKFRELAKEQKYIRVLHKEIIKRVELEKKLTEMACRDSLTNCYNRGFFLDIAEHEKRKTLRQGTPLSIMLLDIDDFKVINDTYGHAVGDRALRKLIQICKNTLRTGDVVGRMGGEEFAILCVESNKEQTLEIANRLCKNIHDQTARMNYHFTVSIGVSEIRAEHKSVDRALHLADLALYEAKREGKNQVKAAA
ncbi:MAG: GGDEF domain-containing protein [Spirochaetia bacterium]|nr:GGDEF domain-containing protein [Spirochaetia bacterium]